MILGNVARIVGSAARVLGRVTWILGGAAWYGVASGVDAADREGSSGGTLGAIVMDGTWLQGYTRGKWDEYNGQSPYFSNPEVFAGAIVLHRGFVLR